jgi:putative SOS response-associated peptidase YedK
MVATEHVRQLYPYPERFMEAYPVSRSVNSPGNEGTELVERVGG